jgi:aspartyl-tRNA(Asn)/glutamyl-tRNA(Gln) amidotransferase subunit A
MADDPAHSEHRFQAGCASLGTPLRPADEERLREYVEDLWELADSIAEVDHPGLQGVEGVLPRQYAWANTAGTLAADAAPPTVRAADAAPLPVPATDASPPSAPAQPTQRHAPGELHRWSLAAVSEAIRTRRITPTEVTERIIARIQALDVDVHSYVTLAERPARASALRLTREVDEGAWRGPLHGIPIGIKDSIPVAGMPCTGNSRLLEDWVPRRDAEAVRRLRESGAVILGKHNLNEFGWSIPSDADLTPPPRNPWFPSEPSVGSTSGGAAALTAQLCYAAIGTDGGGSVRLPAAQHLLVGIKPTHARVPRTGYGGGRVSDIGVLARSAHDAALVLAALLQPLDGRASGERADDIRHRAEGVTRTLRPLRLGLPREYLSQVGMEGDVAVAFDRAVALCRSLGMEVVDLLPSALRNLAAGVNANFVVIAAEHHNAHRRTMAANNERYGASARFYNLPGAFLSAADYLNALRVGDVVRSEVEEALQFVDMLLMPTSPVTRTSVARNAKTHRRGGNAAYTSPFNLTGHPAASVPIGRSSEGIPIGLQFVGAYDSDFDILAAAHAILEAQDLPAFPVP